MIFFKYIVLIYFKYIDMIYLDQIGLYLFLFQWI